MGRKSFYAQVFTVMCVFAVSAMPVAAVETPADKMALHQVEITFHQAASAKDIDLMMSLFADDAVLVSGGKTYTGKAQVREYFSTVAGSFKPQNNWVAYTPAQRITTNVHGDTAELNFECLYMDTATNAVGAHTYSHDTLARSGDHWLIKHMEAGPVAAL